MPIEPTPLEQEVLAVATKLTVLPIVLPLEGLLIVTPANAGAAARANTRMEVQSRAHFFI